MASSTESALYRSASATERRNSQLILKEYAIHYHHERNHQGKENYLLLPKVGYDAKKKDGRIMRLISLF